MRSIVIILSVAVSFVLATPNPDVNQEDLSAKDPRESIWRKMKVALPDGYYAGEEGTAGEDNTPQIAAPQEDLLLPGRKPLYKHQQVKNLDDKLPYQHLEITEHINITPLSPAEKAKLNKKNKAIEAARGAGRGQKKFMDVNNQDIVEVQDVNGVQQKEVAGTDLNGQIRYVDIPYYNREST
ncbi:hypothetical protein BDF21DRAFT_457179 [Thamnidium elegans]|uniref:Uncharacterized protein n=1 Tax=Thamnidium elegans TaxID=101142 RepID=A0A8H7VPW3_9FUNG|nr:hypothetical protein INT48_005243 [Thamnidium elegans]KAI8047890.1 hypothetical protein BDF21DRAFT_457179 [Thamnidium elegans]